MNIDIRNKSVYFLYNSIYMNVTNLCTNKCVFCIRDLNDSVAGANLKLEKEDITAELIINELKNSSPEAQNELVFCGYGEPLIKLEVIKEVAKFIKENYPDKPVRINTNGHANLIHKRNIVPELVGLIDKISISLNSDNPEQYQELTKCCYEPNQAFEAVKEFIGECVKAGIDTTATAVVGFRDYKINVEECRRITEALGAKFRIREWLDEGYN